MNVPDLVVVGLLLLGAALLVLTVGWKWSLMRVVAAGAAGYSFAAAGLVFVLIPSRSPPPPGYSHQQAVMMTTPPKEAGEWAFGLTPAMMAMMAPPPAEVMTEELRAKWGEPTGHDDIPGSPLAGLRGERWVGKAAPDIALPDIHTGRPVRLVEPGSSRPQVLIFGSWGCSIFSGNFEKTAALEREYQGSADFLFVEVLQGPHDLPVAVTSAYAAAGVAEETADNRLRRAALAAEAMGSPFRQVMDTPGNYACRAYKAFPARLYVISAGKIVHDAGPGVMTGHSGWRLDLVRDSLDACLRGR
jgi:hypothetical protein